MFETEPPPSDRPAWTHPRITNTTQVASLPSRAAIFAEAITACKRGEPLPNRYDPALGY